MAPQLATFDGVETTHIEHVEFDSYGRIIEVKRNVGGVVVVDATNTPTSAYAYTGREWDAATGLQYNRNRWYDAELGRWLSEDPIGFAGGDANLYGYVGNRATIGTDPSGLAEDDEETRYYPYTACTRCHLIVATGRDYVCSEEELAAHLSFREWSLYALEAESMVLSAGSSAELLLALRASRVRVAFPIAGQFLGNGTVAVETATVLVPTASVAVCTDATATVVYLQTLCAAGNAHGGPGGGTTAVSGRSAEDAVSNVTGIPANRGAGRQIVPGTGPGGIRVPDMRVFGPGASLTLRGSIIEVKNVTRLSCTRQIRDLVRAAENLGGRLEIFTNAPSPPSGELRRLIDAGRVVIHPLP